MKQFAAIMFLWLFLGLQANAEPKDVDSVENDKVPNGLIWGPEASNVKVALQICNLSQPRADNNSIPATVYNCNLGNFTVIYEDLLGDPLHGLTIFSIDDRGKLKNLLTIGRYDTGSGGNRDIPANYTLVLHTVLSKEILDTAINGKIIAGAYLPFENTPVMVYSQETLLPKPSSPAPAASSSPPKSP